MKVEASPIMKEEEPSPKVIEKKEEEVDIKLESQNSKEVKIEVEEVKVK